MIKIFLSVLVLCIIYQNSYSQDRGIDTRAASISGANCTSVDALGSFIKGNFETDEDRIRAIYIWITHHISYDVASFLAMERGVENQQQPTVAHVLASRKAVCQGYSELFVALCKGVGIDAILVSGFTKKQGKVSSISHAWVAASLGNEWHLFDPTWGAGYVQDKQFVRKFNNAFYKISPANLIIDHMPFDPLFQFLSYPLTPKEFTDGKPAANKALFHYKDSLKQYNQLSFIQQNAAELRRLEAAGIQNDLLRKRQNILKMNLQSFASKNSFDEGIKIFSTVVASYNEYITFKNRQFSIVEDNILRQMIAAMEQNTKLSRSLIFETKTQTVEQNNAKLNTLNQIDRFSVQLSKEKQFVERYLAADKGMRRQFFMKR
jgi:hypothetical protein